MDAATRSRIAWRWGKVVVDLVSALQFGFSVASLFDAAKEQVDEAKSGAAEAAAAEQLSRFAANAETPLGPDAVRASIFRSKPKFDPALVGSEGTLLRAERGIVPFGQRDAELAEFRDWFNDKGPLRWRLMTGPSGRGKTRFMQYVVDTFEPVEGRDLFAGFIDLSALIDAPEIYGALLSHTGDVLFVVDYAERARAQTEAVLQLALMLWEAAREGHDIRVRVVLIARSKSEVWDDIGSKNEAIGDVLNSKGGEFVDAALPPLVDTVDERRAEFARAYRAFDQELSEDPSVGGRWPEENQIPPLTPARDRDDFKEAVMIHLAALAAVRGAMPGAEMTDESLLKWIIRREREEWRRRTEGILDLKQPALDRALDEAVGVVTLAATASQEPSGARTVELLRACPHLRACSDDTLEALAQNLAQLHPGEPRKGGETRPIGLMPDIVGTYFLGDRTLTDAFYKSVFSALSAQEATNGLTKLNWLSQNWKDPEQRANPAGVERILAAIAGNAGLTLPVVIDVAQQSGDPIGVIAAQWFQENPDPSIGLALFSDLPHQTIALRELAAVVLHVLSSVDLTEVDAPNEMKAGLLQMRDQYAIRLSDVGRPEDALQTCEENVTFCRAFVEQAPDVFTETLADCLNTLSNCLSALGRREAALGAVEEAVALYRTLAAARPDAFTPALAASLNNLSNHLSDLGRREEALGAVEEAVALRRTLAAARPDAFTPDLAMSLNNLSNRLSDLGRREEALGAVEEAVALYRTLAAARPDAFTPDLAGSLNTLSIRLSDLGRREEALGAVEEAVALYRTLAAARPDAFTPDLAMSLNNLSNRLSDLGRREAALGAVEEAVALYRTLAAARPDAFTPDLAMSLNNLSNRLSALGRREEALGAVEEAVALYRTLAAARPDVFTPVLADSLQNMANRLAEFDRHDEALGAIAETERVYRALTSAQPVAFARDLAWALGVRGGILAGAARNADAVDAYGEALTIVVEQFHQLPQAFSFVPGFVGGYLSACQAAGIEPDMNLIGPIVQTLVEHGIIDLPSDGSEDPDTPA